jgi:Recombination endonuclease VII
MRSLALPIEERRRLGREATARYRARYPDRIKEYKSRPSSRKRANAHMRMKRENLSVEEKTRISKISRLRQLKKLYGLTEEEFNKLQEEQKYLCAICKNPQCNNRWKVTNLYVDHDPKTGQRRGLLCSKCNLAIGGLQHSKELLLAAIAYLEKYNVRVIP